MKIETAVVGAKVECKSSGWVGVIMRVSGEWCSVNFNGGLFCHTRHIDSLDLVSA